MKTLNPTLDASINQSINQPRKLSKQLNYLILSIFSFFSCTIAPLPPNTNQTLTNQAPTITSQTFTVSETASVSETVATVAASDSDSENLVYRISSNDQVPFGLNSSNGDLTLQSQLDYDVANRYLFRVEVSDGEFSNDALITMDVLSNQAPLAIDISFLVAENISDTNIIGTVTNDPENKPLTYTVLSNDNGLFDLFEISSNGGLSLASGQCFDFELVQNHTLWVSVSDGEFTNIATIDIMVQDVSGDAFALCGHLTEITAIEIDGTTNFFLSGTGTTNDPYVVPVKAGSEDFTFIYDPNYTNGSPNIYFAFDLVSGDYIFSVINTELFQSGEVTGWQINVIPFNAIPFFTSQGFVSTDPIGIINVAGTFTITNRITIEAFGDATTAKWLSKKGWRIQKQ